MVLRNERKKDFRQENHGEGKDTELIIEGMM